MIKRINTLQVKIEKLTIGGNAPIRIESMCNANPHDPEKIINQIKELEKAGCELVRISLPDLKSTDYIKEIQREISIPLMGDIHFSPEVAIKAMEEGIPSIRINPGNIKRKKEIEKIIDCARENNVVIRVGVNSGSVDRKKYKGKMEDIMVNSLLDTIKIFEEKNFQNIIVSLKSSDVVTTIKANKKFIKYRRYPVHIGITEAGTKETGTIKSAVGVGILLYNGIGDTLRISLTGNPVEEIYVAKKILLTLGLRKGPNIIACPTCGRTNIDVEKIANEVEKLTSNLNKNITIAIMGCIVNGPGEAADADVGIAGGPNSSAIFFKGKIYKTVPNNILLEELLNIIKTKL